MITRKIILTADGSSTLLIPEWEETYHSRHGAVQEAFHVFIKNGWKWVKNQKEISILEIGFGSGLNALITLLEAKKHKKNTFYTGLEKYPLLPEEFHSLNYADSLKNFSAYQNIKSTEVKKQYLDLMKCDWESFQTILPDFQLKKIKTDFLSFDYPADVYNLVYFDAFGFRVQPELWSHELFEKIYYAMKTDGVLSTYSCKGSVRRSLKEIGFKVEKHPGPPGKREMLIAIK